MSDVATKTAPSRALQWAAIGLASTVWISAGIFGVYILIFFGGALLDGNVERWNTSLPGLYSPETLGATAAIGAHFVAGGIILMLGPLQLIEGLRRKAPAFHRWTGRLYVLTSLTAGIGGCLFIVLKGTIGGLPMDVGFGLYGILMVLAAVQTVRHARARRFERHRLWALRLYALAIGSWLYRMEYGFWFLLFGGAGHTNTFDGPLDIVMAFFFYIPNLIVADVLFHTRRRTVGKGVQRLITVILLAATAFVVLATFEFTRQAWAPAILRSLAE